MKNLLNKWRNVSQDNKELVIFSTFIIVVIILAVLT